MKSQPACDILVLCNQIINYLSDDFSESDLQKISKELDLYYHQIETGVGSSVSIESQAQLEECLADVLAQLGDPGNFMSTAQEEVIVNLLQKYLGTHPQTYLDLQRLEPVRSRWDNARTMAPSIWKAYVLGSFLWVPVGFLIYLLFFCPLPTLIDNRQLIGYVFQLVVGFLILALPSYFARLFILAYREGRYDFYMFESHEKLGPLPGNKGYYTYVPVDQSQNLPKLVVTEEQMSAELRNEKYPLVLNNPSFTHAVVLLPHKISPTDDGRLTATDTGPFIFRFIGFITLGLGVPLLIQNLGLWY